MNVEFYIDELVLHGFAHRDRYLIGTAIESELTRLIAERGIPSLLTQRSDVSQLDAGIFTPASDSRPRMIGMQVAEAVFGGLNR